MNNEKKYSANLHFSALQVSQMVELELLGGEKKPTLIAFIIIQNAGARFLVTHLNIPRTSIANYID